MGEAALGLRETAFGLGEAAFEFLAPGEVPCGIGVGRGRGRGRGGRRGRRFREDARGEQFLGLGEALFDFGAQGDLAVEFGGEGFGGGHAAARTAR